MSDNAAQQPQYSTHIPPGQPVQPGPPTQPAHNFLPSGPDRPTPIGLGLASLGLLLLVIGSLLPQVSLGGRDADEVGGYGLETAGASLPGLPPALILMVLVGWAAAGIKPGLQWTAKLGGIGMAALTAAAALHPVIELNAVFNNEVWEDVRVQASASGGIWFYILAAILLALSIFMMRWAPPKQAPAPQYAQQPQPQPHQPDNGWQGRPQQ